MVTPLDAPWARQGRPWARRGRAGQGAPAAPLEYCSAMSFSAVCARPAAEFAMELTMELTMELPHSKVCWSAARGRTVDTDAGARMGTRPRH